MTALAARPQSAPVVPATGGQLPSLTAMRWAAAFLVFAYHVGNVGYFGGESARLVGWAFGAGSVGVSFFFILSGFVLAWSARPGDSALAFWRRRLARIYPVHLVTAVLALVLGFTLIRDLRPDGVREVAANLLLVSAWHREWWQAVNPVSWTLVCEAFFYAAFPALYAVLRRFGPRGLTAVAAGSAAVVVVLPWINAHHHLGWFLTSFPLARLPEFILGVALGRLVLTGAWRGPGLDTSLALTLIGYFLTRQLPSHYAYAACTVVGLACLIPAGAVADLHGTPSMWRQGWLVRLGEWSFAFYMIHLLVIRTGEQLFGAHPQLTSGPGLLAASAALLVSLVLAWALYEGVERPGRRWLLRDRKLRIGRLVARR